MRERVRACSPILDHRAGLGAVRRAATSPGGVPPERWTPAVGSRPAGLRQAAAGARVLAHRRPSCSATTVRRDEWIDVGVMAALKWLARDL